MNVGFQGYQHLCSNSYLWFRGFKKRAVVIGGPRYFSCVWLLLHGDPVTRHRIRVERGDFVDLLGQIVASQGRGCNDGGRQKQIANAVAFRPSWVSVMHVDFKGYHP